MSRKRVAPSTRNLSVTRTGKRLDACITEADCNITGICPLWSSKEEETAEAWKQARLSHYMAWQIPATLVMSVAFSLLLCLPPPADINAAVVAASECVQIFNATRECESPSWVQIFNAIVGHLYVVCMSVSGLMAIKSINDFMNDYLALVNMPASHVPSFIEFRTRFIEENS